MTTIADESQRTSAAESCSTEGSKTFANTTTSQDAYCIKQKLNQADPFVRFQQTKNRNPQILSYNSNLAYLDNKLLDDRDKEINLPMTTTSRRMNEWVENLSQTPNKGSWKKSSKSREAYEDFALTGPNKMKSGLIGERLSVSNDPGRNSFVQRSWLYNDDPCLMYRINGVPPTEPLSSTSQNFRELGTSQRKKMGTSGYHG